MNRDLFWRHLEGEHPKMEAFCRRLAGNRDDGDDLYQDALLPAARSRLEAARNGYTTGRNDFTPLIQSERSLATLELESEVALASFHPALAELAWATGSIPGLPEEEEIR